MKPHGGFSPRRTCALAGLALALLLSGRSKEPVRGEERAASRAEQPRPEAVETHRYPIEEGHKWGLIDREGNVVAEPSFSNMRNFSEGLAAVRIGFEWGYIDLNGNVVIEPRFSEAGPFSDGLAAVKFYRQSHSVTGYINRRGEMVIEREYPNAFQQYGSFVGGKARVKVMNKWGWIDKQGQFVIQPQYVDPTGVAGSFSEGLAPVAFPDKDGNSAGHGFIDEKGDVVIEPRFYLAFNFSEGLACAFTKGENRKAGYIDKSGTFVIEPRFEYAAFFTEGRGRVDLGGKSGFVDRTGKVVVPLEYDSSWFFSERLAYVKKGEKWGFIDPWGAMVIRLQFDGASSFSEGLAAVKVGSLWGYIDKEGKRVIEPIFDHVQDFKNGLAQVKLGGKMAYIDKTGQYVWMASGWIGSDHEPGRPDSESSTRARSKVIVLDLGDGVEMQCVLIPPGQFVMGAPTSEINQYYDDMELYRGQFDDELPQRTVKLSRPFYMSVTEVTQQQYAQIVGSNPSRFNGSANPVDSVSYSDALSFCRTLSEKTGRSISLPTEAQWEYACRAGTRTAYSFGADDQDLDLYAWQGPNSNWRSHPVAQKRPNAWGLCDMHGNVCEWCQDWYADSYRDALTVDPKGPRGGKSHVLRGGSWLYGHAYCRSACRDYVNETGPRDSSIGFRVVLDL